MHNNGKTNTYRITTRTAVPIICCATLALLLISCSPAPIKKTLKVKKVEIVCLAGTELRSKVSSGNVKIQKNQSDTSVSKNGDNKQKVKTQESECIAKGSIEIAEKYTIDAEIKEQFSQAVVLLQQGKYQLAITLLQAVSKKASNFTGPYINLGIAYSRTDLLDKAELSFNQALKLNNQHPVANNEMGIVYRKTGRYAKARALYEALLKLYPDFLPARRNLGMLCDIYIQDLECAEEQYAFYLDALPDDEKVKVWMADLKNRM